MEKSLILTTQCVSIDENNIAWIFSNDFNALFRLNLETNEQRYVKSFDEEEFYCASLYTDCVRYKNKLAFIPCCAKKLAIFDTESGEVNYIEIRDETYIVYFNTVPIDEQKTLLFPIVYSSKAYMLDLEKEKVEVIPLDYGNYEKQFSCYRDRPLAAGNAFLNNRAYFAVYGTDKYIAFDIYTHKIEIFEQLDNERMFVVTTNEKKLDFLFMGGDAIRRISEDGRDISKISLYAAEKKDLFSNENFMSYAIVYPISKDEYLGIPFWNDPLCIATKENYELIYLEWNKINPVKGGVQPFVVTKRCGNDILMFPYQSDTLVKIKLDTREIFYYQLQVSIQDYVHIMYEMHICLKDNLLHESDLSLKMYLKWISGRSGENNVEEQNEQLVGKLIHETIIKSY